ncbi:PP2C family protein-serine/threonine phosphatase [Kitasatospora atroaurantiaca]|uniref:Serine phosphatase RsbU (Regulator of sigma subunit) n=1 Tax=Kitasatospora atroaurantiaca TaxID=285545 RepID=A0A561ELF8_9ACTN|nr:PP2C family protein-serine/threonine phosphatase [Kitasatospora atroaurantiaca]TWE16455.1 serine phosphatase RsbU (regulator of sigma subunit) [Kitasatospora atroaurantiaca]
MAEDGSSTGPLTPARLPRWSLLLLSGAYALVVAAVAADLATGPRTTASPIIATLPVLAGASARSVRVPLLAGLLATGVVVSLSFVNPGVPLVVHIVAVFAVLAATMASVANVVLIRAREQQLHRIRTVAEAAQQALLRPVAQRVGPLRVAVRYAAAAAEARIGGDLYEVLDTPHGVRLLLGDVQGKGLAAVETAADVLGVFREAAATDPDLAGVAERLDSAIARRPANERFVTAVLVGVPAEPGRAQIVNCGHPPPLVLRPTGEVHEVSPDHHAPPLALLGLIGGHYRAEPLDLGPGDLLLLYTDGVSEARDADGHFYPLAERLSALPGADPDGVLTEILADVREYTAGGMNDDAAMLAVRRQV